MKKRYGFLIDMDGVIYREETLLPGVKEFLTILIEREYPFIFLTNNSGPTSEEITSKLKHLGAGNFSTRHFYTAAHNAADFLSENYRNPSAYPLGDTGLITALAACSIPTDSINPTHVVVGEGSLALEKVNVAHKLLEKRSRLLVCNPDNWCPAQGETTRPGAGALASFLQASTGKTPHYLGKPNAYMFIKAMEKMEKEFKTRRTEIVMIGDTMETDICGALHSGLKTILVLTGSTRMSDVGNYSYQPTAIHRGIFSTVEHLKNDSLLKSDPIIDSGNTNKHGNKHQTDASFSLSKPRPAMIT